MEPGIVCSQFWIQTMPGGAFLKISPCRELCASAHNILFSTKIAANVVVMFLSTPKQRWKRHSPDFPSTSFYLEPVEQHETNVNNKTGQDMLSPFEAVNVTHQYKPLSKHFIVNNVIFWCVLVVLQKTPCGAVQTQSKRRNVKDLLVQF